MNYTAPIPYLISHFIYEYDISKANINILFAKGILSKEEYKYIKSLPKEQRQVYVGILQKDRSKAKALQEGLAYYRRLFIESNQVEDKDLLSVKNDALFLIDKIAKVTKFGNVEFIQKNRYSSFFKLDKTEAYYNYNPISGDEFIDIKGINDKTLLLHQDFMISFLCNCFYNLQNSPIEKCISDITEFYNHYLRRELPAGYYREFNSDSMYRVAQGNNYWLLESIGQNEVQYLDIGYNLQVIKEVYAILTNIYFQNRK